jgi:hypothetical protein
MSIARFLGVPVIIIVLLAADIVRLRDLYVGNDRQVRTAAMRDLQVRHNAGIQLLRGRLLDEVIFCAFLWGEGTGRTGLTEVTLMSYFPKN